MLTKTMCRAHAKQIDAEADKHQKGLEGIKQDLAGLRYKPL